MNNVTPIVLDVETNIRNLGDGAVGGMAGSPFHVDNHIVALGEMRAGQVMLQYAEEDGDIHWCHAVEVALSGKKVLLIGHNIAYDLLYLLKEIDRFEEALPNIWIWDTQEVEYLLSGQTHLYPSLDQCCIARGLPVKDDRIKKDYWDKGIDTRFIPQNMLLDYLGGDVRNTNDVFLDQYRVVSGDPKLFELVKVKMDDILMTTMMTWHGMKFDLEKAQALLEPIDAEIGVLLTEIKSEGQKFFVENFDFNPESPSQISLLLYGGTYKIIEPIPQVGPDGEPLRFKGGQRAGQVKTKLTPVIYETKGLGLSTKGIPTSRDGWSTAEEYLLKLNHPVVEKLLRLRELAKDAETYYRGYSLLVWPDGMIHPQRNHASTVTGRLSCSSPNLENVSKPDDD